MLLKAYFYGAFRTLGKYAKRKKMCLVWREHNYEKISLEKHWEAKVFWKFRHDNKQTAALGYFISNTIIAALLTNHEFNKVFFPDWSNQHLSLLKSIIRCQYEIEYHCNFFFTKSLLCGEFHLKVSNQLKSNCIVISYT